MDMEQEYELESTLDIELTLPVIDFTPSTCFSVVDYKIVDSTGITPDYATLSGSTLSLTIDSPALLGSLELTLIAIVNDPASTQLTFDGSNKLVLSVLNSCATSKVIPTELEDMEVRAGQINPIYQSFKGFTDSLSEDYKS